MKGITYRPDRGTYRVRIYVNQQQVNGGSHTDYDAALQALAELRAQTTHIEQRQHRLTDAANLFLLGRAP